jgi:predicted membrane-bound mannosyltransferase
VPIGEPTLIPVDVPILLLGVVGGLVAAIRAPSRLWVVIGLWAAGITAAYSIIQYKTPWIILNMLLPLALLAGLAVSELWRSRRLRPPRRCPRRRGAAQRLPGDRSQLQPL